MPPIEAFSSARLYNWRPQGEARGADPPSPAINDSLAKVIRYTPTFVLPHRCHLELQ